MNILSIEEHDNSIVFKNKSEGQVVRLFFNCYDAESVVDIVGNLKCKNLVSISRLYVDPAYRKKGWASIILKKLFENYKGQSFLLNAYPDDKEYMSLDALVGFYKRHGFEILHPTEEGILLIKKT